MRSSFYLDLYTAHPLLASDHSLLQYFRRISSLTGRPYLTLRDQFYKNRDLIEGAWGFKADDLLAPSPTLRKHPSVKPKPSTKPQPAQAEKKEWDERGDHASWTYHGDANITTLDQALEFSKVDLDVWEVERHTFNTWTTTLKDASKQPILKWNVQVKVWFRRKQAPEMSINDMLQLVSPHIKHRPVIKWNGKGKAMVAASDFHFGAYVDDLIKSGKFSISVLIDYLNKAVEIINSQQYEEVHVALLGDFIESFTGLNHRNSWKGLGKGMFGVSATILCYEILMEKFLGKIHNLASVSGVSGNHDRVTDLKEGDEKGEVAQLLFYMFEKDLRGKCEVNYHPMVITKQIDDLAFVLAHGHLPFSEKEITKVLFDYGIQGVYNVLLKGHLHSRKVRKTTLRKQVEYNDVMTVQLDEANYRAITCASLFTGNFFSESLGFSSSAGFEIIESNGRGKIHHHSYCL